jgi:HAMP domain-containing protein
MIQEKAEMGRTPLEPGEGRPERTGEDWLGRRRSEKRRLWERLNPQHRRQVRLLAEALALGQVRARLPQEIQARLGPVLEEIERLTARVRRLFEELAQRAPRRG